MAKKLDLSESQIITTVGNYRREADEAKRDRMELNKLNYSTYHLNQDWSYKEEGQSKEFLPKQYMAVEQLASFITQGLLDLGDWFTAEAEEGLTPDLMSIRPKEIEKLLNRQLETLGIHDLVNGGIKMAALGALCIVKVGGKLVPKERFEVKTQLKANKFERQLVKVEDKQWQLDLQLVRQEDYYPDPTGRGLYEMHDSWIDFYDLDRMSKGDDAIYDKEAVEKLSRSFSEETPEKLAEKSRETGQNITNHSYRHTVKLTEVWGNILDNEGNLVYENVVCTIANDRFVVRKPTPNPFWHGQSPFVTFPLVSVPNSVWHKALMDAPSMLNRAANEFFNLTLDGGLMGVHGIKQIRTDWLDDTSQISEGIHAGMTLQVGSAAPPGAKVLERVDTSSIPNEAFNMFNLIAQEFNSASMTSDLRSGVTPFRAVKATEIVEQSQTLTSMTNGLAKNVEQKGIARILAKSWKTMAQHIHLMDPEDVKAIIGNDRADAVLRQSREQIFADTVNGCKFRVFGLTNKVNNQKDFRKLQGMLQTVFGVPILAEQFLQTYDVQKFMDELFGSLEIDVDKLKIAEPELEQPLEGEGSVAGIEGEASQVPQANLEGAEDTSPLGQAVEGTEFPESPATQGGGEI